jgi:hypothetical protein
MSLNGCSASKGRFPIRHNISAVRPSSLICNWSRGVVAFLFASRLRRSIFQRVWPPGDACPLPRSASALLRPRGLPPRSKSWKIKAPPPCLRRARRGRQASPSEKRPHPGITYAYLTDMSPPTKRPSRVPRSWKAGPRPVLTGSTQAPVKASSQDP